MTSTSATTQSNADTKDTQRNNSYSFYNIIFVENINQCVLLEFANNWNAVYDDIVTVDQLNFLFAMDIPNGIFYIEPDVYMNYVKKCFMIWLYNKYAQVAGYHKLYAPTANITVVDAVIDKETVTIVPVFSYTFISDTNFTKKHKLSYSDSIRVDIIHGKHQKPRSNIKQKQTNH